MPETPQCAEVRDLIPELAAGVASGDERARVLAHLAGCAACRRELEETAKLVDELVLLAPEHEPSPGFESTVLAALQPRPVRRRRPLRTLVLRAAALLLVAALAAGLTWWQGRDDRDLAARYRHTLSVAHGSYLTAAAVTTAAEPQAGHLFAYQGSPSWIFITLTAAPQSGVYDIYLVTTDNRTVPAGRCTVADGQGSYGVTIDLPIRAIQRVELVKPGAPTLTARLH
jgi:hypothetical protein